MILFLDFDGVLHPSEVYLERGRPVLRAEGALFMWAPLLEAVLADFPEVRIVLSTSWARELRFSRARRYLPPGLRARVIGATWHSAMKIDPEGFHHLHLTWWDQATRYEQIKRYATRASLKQWVAIDDMPEGWDEAYRDRLVQTDSYVGLSDPEKLERLRTILQAEHGRQ